MPRLPELQAAFGRALRDTAAPLPPIRAKGLDAARRLQVYRHNHEIALSSALRVVYPVTERLVGEEFFGAMIAAYVRQNPSQDGNIQDYGGSFPAFVATYAPAASLPYLGDVAALEWRRLETAVAPTHTPMDLKALAAVPVEKLPGLYFHHQPAASAFESHFPVLSIWQFCQEAEPQGELNLDLGAQCVLFSRPALDVEMRLMSAGEHAFLQRLFRGANFETACCAALDLESGFDVQERFTALVREEILSGFHL
ncbi:MAG TPA: DNA-binding domain-containing protein [Gammaproteobacteria bacterium]